MMLFLLEDLGFIINSKKSLLTATQEIEFLGMVVNFQTMDLKLLGEKTKKNQARSPIYVGSPQPLNLIPLSTIGQTKCNKPSTTDGSTVLPLTTVLPKTSTGDQLSGLQLNRPVIPPGIRRSTVVGGPLIQVEWEESDN